MHRLATATQPVTAQAVTVLRLAIQGLCPKTACPSLLFTIPISTRTTNVSLQAMPSKHRTVGTFQIEKRGDILFSVSVNCHESSRSSDGWISEGHILPLGFRFLPGFIFHTSGRGGCSLCFLSSSPVVLLLSPSIRSDFHVRNYHRRQSCLREGSVSVVDYCSAACLSSRATVRSMESSDGDGPAKGN